MFFNFGFQNKRSRYSMDSVNIPRLDSKTEKNFKSTRRKTVAVVPSHDLESSTVSFPDNALEQFRNM